MAVNKMDEKYTSLSNLKTKQTAKIYSVRGGQGFLRKLQIMGIKEGQNVRVISKQPFRGPLTIEVCGCQMTMGRGMAHHIIVEDVK